MNLGPLEQLVGVWESKLGHDIAIDDDRKTEINKYRERMVFESIGAVDNHEQKMFGLKYTTMAWRLGVEDPFHQDTGYWIWEPKTKQVMKCFVIPRGIAVLAGATVDPKATSFKVVANVGSATYGICSNIFLDAEFQTSKYELTTTFHGKDSFTYESSAFIKMKNNPTLFDHSDKNTLNRIE